MVSNVALEIKNRAVAMAEETNIGSGCGMPETIENKHKNVAYAMINFAIEVIQRSKGIDRRALLRYLNEARDDS